VKICVLALMIERIAERTCGNPGTGLPRSWTEAPGHKIF
jgi:hypothetical protein